MATGAAAGSGGEVHRVCIVGADVGKSALVVRFIHNTFVDQDDPTIEDHYMAKVVVDRQSCSLDILDTSGNVEYASFYDKWFRSAEAFICVYSITLRDSFEHITFFREVIKRIKQVDHVPMVLIGTKSDLENKRVVSTSEGQNLADMFEAPFFECSAKSGANVKEAFQEIAREIRRVNQKARKEAKAIEERRQRKSMMSRALVDRKRSGPTPTPQRPRDKSTGKARGASRGRAVSGNAVGKAPRDTGSPYAPARKSGWLQREGGGGFGGGWKKRWFVLTENGFLYYFDKEKDKTHKGEINLSDANQAVLVKGGKKKNTIEIPIGSKKTLLAVDKDSEVKDWLSSLNAVILRNRVFGVPIEVTCGRIGKNIPTIVLRCIQHLEATALTAEGLYRISGDTSDVFSLKSDFDDGEDEAEPSNYADPNVVAGTLKLYFRELPDPLLTFNLYDKFIASQKSPDPNQRKRALRACVDALPTPNRFTLHVLCGHLKKVSSYSAQNKMVPSNLAIVFGPTLMRQREEGDGAFNPQMLFDMKFQQMVVQSFIENMEEIFGGPPPRLGGGGKGASSKPPASRNGGGGGGGGGGRDKSRSHAHGGGKSGGRGTKPRLPPDWTEHTSPEGRRYYHNKSTGETSWNFPTDGLPAGWSATTTPEGKTYYYHAATKKTQWTMPTE